MNAPGQPGHRAWPALLLGGATLLTVAAYWPALGGPLLLDDFTVIPQLIAAREAGHSLWETLQNAPHHVRGRILANLSFILSDELTPGVAGGVFAQKIGNLLLHLAAGLLVVRLVRVLTQMSGAEQQAQAWIPPIAGALFLLHPLLLSTVAYAVQRMAILSTLFVLLAVLAYLAWRRGLEEDVDAPAWRQWVRLACVPLFTGLSYASKENGVLAPLLIGCVEVFLLRWPRRASPMRGTFEHGFALCVAAPLGLGAVALGLRWPQLHASFDEREFTLVERALTQIHVLWEYLGHWFWPRISTMGLYRDDITIVRMLDPQTLLLGAAMAILLTAAFLLRRQIPLVSLGIGWFFAAHAMESTILPLELYFEHRNYLAAPGIALLVAALLMAFRLRIALTVTSALALMLAYQTFQRAQDWSGFERFIRAEAQHHPDSLRAGVELVLELERDTQRRETALEELARLTNAYPQHAQPALLSLFLQCQTGAPAPRAADWWAHAIVNKDSFYLFDALHARVIEDRCPGVGPAVLAEIAETIAGANAVTAKPLAEAAWSRQAGNLFQRIGDCEKAESAFLRAISIDDSDPRDALSMMECALSIRALDQYLQWRNRLLSRFSGIFPGVDERVAEMDQRWDRATP